MSRNAKIVLALWLLASTVLTLVQFLPALAVGQVAAGAANVDPGVWGIVGWGALFVGLFLISAVASVIFLFVLSVFVIVIRGLRSSGGEGMN